MEWINALIGLGPLHEKEEAPASKVSWANEDDVPRRIQEGYEVLRTK